MTLTMRLTGLAHGVYEDAMDYSVFAGAWNIGRIYERRGCSDARAVLLVTPRRRADETA